MDQHRVSRKDLREEERRIRARIEKKTRQKRRRRRLIERIRLLKEYERSVSSESNESSGDEDDGRHNEIIKILEESEKQRRQEYFGMETYRVCDSEDKEVASINQIIAIKPKIRIPHEVKRTYHIHIAICDRETVQRKVWITDQNPDGSVAIVSNKIKVLTVKSNEQNPEDIFKMMKKLPAIRGKTEIPTTASRKMIPTRSEELAIEENIPVAADDEAIPSVNQSGTSLNDSRSVVNRI